MKYYHAAPKETMMKIVGEGILRKSWDGFVYLCGAKEYMSMTTTAPS